MEPFGKQTAGFRDAAGTEQRGAPRHKVLKGATIRFNRGYAALECRVRNISDTGARLSFGETAAVPSEFDFYLGGAKAPVRATVRWRTMQDIGVQFVQ